MFRMLVFLCLGTMSCYFWGCALPLQGQEEVALEKKISQEKTNSDASETFPEKSSQEAEIRESHFEKLPDAPSLTNGVSVRIIHVTDGDTVYVITGTGGWAYSSRIQGINAPECNKKSSGSFQICSNDKDYFGLQAYNILKAKVDELMKSHEDKDRLIVFCEEDKGLCDKDPFDRSLLNMKMPDGKYITEYLLEEGAGFTFTKYTSQHMKEFCFAEAKAIKNKKGFWAEGREKAKDKMSSAVKDWYYHKTKSKSHDEICSNAMGTSFAKAAGE